MPTALTARCKTHPSQAPRRSQVPTHPLPGRTRGGTKPTDRGGTNPTHRDPDTDASQAARRPQPRRGVGPESKHHRQHTPGTEIATEQVHSIPDYAARRPFHRRSAPSASTEPPDPPPNRQAQGLTPRPTHPPTERPRVTTRAMLQTTPQLEAPARHHEGNATAAQPATQSPRVTTRAMLQTAPGRQNQRPARHHKGNATATKEPPTELRQGGKGTGRT